jgi:hypothetical protein
MAKQTKKIVTSAATIQQVVCGYNGTIDPNHKDKIESFVSDYATTHVAGLPRMLALRGAGTHVLIGPLLAPKKALKTLDNAARAALASLGLQIDQCKPNGLNIDLHARCTPVVKTEPSTPEKK